MAILRDLPHNVEFSGNGKRLIPVTHRTTAEKVSAGLITSAAAFSAAAAFYLYYRFSFFRPHFTTIMRVGDLFIGSVLIPTWIVCAAVHHLAHGSLRLREHAAFYAYLGIPLATALGIHYGLVPLMSNFFMLSILAIILEVAVPLLATAITGLFTWKLIENKPFTSDTNRR